MNAVEYIQSERERHSPDAVAVDLETRANDRRQNLSKRPPKPSNKKGGLTPLELAPRSNKSRENYHLARRIVDIMNRPGVVSVTSGKPVKHPGTMNFKHRFEEAKRIQTENIAIAARLESTKPYYGNLVVVKPNSSPKKESPRVRSKSPQRVVATAAARRTPLPKLSPRDNVKYIFTTFERKKPFHVSNKRSPRPVSNNKQSSKSRPTSANFQQTQRSPKGQRRPSSSTTNRPSLRIYDTLLRPNTTQGMTMSPSKKKRPPPSAVQSRKLELLRNTRPQNVMLEFAKVQESKKIDCVVIKEPYQDRYAILGIDVTTGQRYETHVTSDDVSRELEGDMLVTSMESKDVWKTLINKLTLPSVEAFTKLEQVQFDVYAHDFRKPSPQPVHNVPVQPTAPRPEGQGYGGRPPTRGRPPPSAHHSQPVRVPGPVSTASNRLVLELQYGDNSDSDSESKGYPGSSDDPDNQSILSENSSQKLEKISLSPATAEDDDADYSQDFNTESVSGTHSRGHKHIWSAGSATVDRKNGWFADSAVEVVRVNADKTDKVHISQTRVSSDPKWNTNIKQHTLNINPNPEHDILYDEEELDNIVNQVNQTLRVKDHQSMQSIDMTREGTESGDLSQRLNDFLDRTKGSVDVNPNLSDDGIGDYQADFFE